MILCGCFTEKKIAPNKRMFDGITIPLSHVRVNWEKEVREVEKWQEDLKRARKRSCQAQWISLAAMVLSAIALIIRLVVVLQ